MARDDSLPAPELLVRQASMLFEKHDNISKVIRDFHIPADELPDDYDEKDKSEYSFDFESMVRVFLFKEICNFSQKQLAERLETWPHIQSRFDLDRAPTQAALSHTERNRFPLTLRQFINTVADRICEEAQEQGIQSRKLASPDEADPDEVAATDQPLYKYVDQHAPQLISETLDTVTPAFDTGRDSNNTHSDRDLWKQQIAMSLMDRAGTRSAYRTFNKFKPNPPHHDTHCHGVKKLGKPSNYQYKFDDYNTADWSQRPIPEWRRVADTIQSQFSEAIDRMLNSVRMSDMFTEPVVAAIDTTGVPFHTTPWKGEDDIEPDDERIVVNQKTGETKVPKDDYPEMVNGAEENGVWEYQYATLTIVGRNVPLVIAVEPIRHNSQWEGGDGETVSWAEIVDRLMEQATELVDIHLVMADKAFDQHGVLHVLDQNHDVDYLIPKKEDSDHLREQAAEVREDPTIDARVEQDASLYLRDDTPYIDVEDDSTVGEDGYSHDVTFMHVPADRDDWIIRHKDDTGYAVFVTNRDDVTPMDAEGLTNRYSDRWDIEIEYKMILPLIPSIASTDYRMRFFSFVFSCLLYNLWRVVDHSLKELAGEAYDDYGRGPHEDRLDPVLTEADFLASSMVLLFQEGWGPPDDTT